MAETALDRIVADVRRRLETYTEAPGLEEAAHEAVEARRREGLRSLGQALSKPGPALIAECKKASPSAGLIREDFDAVALASAYSAGGAAAISVVTEPDHFQGDTRWLIDVRKTVGLPVLRKDFIVSRRQLFETAVLGVDAVLLIARILDEETLTTLLQTAAELELEVLLEIFADEDPATMVVSGAPIVGVNARDLATFEVRLDRVESIAAELPADRVRVAESGIHGHEDLNRLRAAGYDGFLVGEHLVRSENPETAVRDLLGRPAH
ncbi:MAG: indole-3-glycerol phosphate synthase TrpC [Thermoanaerobaculales bacterium]|nr:indole-3-glycerol phosphate synthase TrpC [Thermoanaerobaculales bacterium]